MHHERLAEHTTVYDPQTVSALQSFGGDQHALAMLNQTVTEQAYQLSFNDVFHLLGWIFLSLIVVVWLAKPPFGAKGGAAAGGH